jgi:hypothetical protein
MAWPRLLCYVPVVFQQELFRENDREIDIFLK